MGKKEGVALLGAVLGGLLAAPSTTKASMILTLESGGSDRVSVLPGASFDVQVVVRALSEPDQFTSSIFQIILDAEGLILEQYAWSQPFETGSIFDDGTPSAAELPLVITTETLVGPGHAPGLIDFELSNVAEFGAMQVLSSGVTLVSMRFSIRADWAGPESFTISAVADTFADGFEVKEVIPGESLAVNVVPAPGGFAFLSAIALACHKRRR
jgi:hypothetical protein